jgi:AcrR family transcriptional regulator
MSDGPVPDPQETIRRLRTGVYSDAILDAAESCFFQTGFSDTKMAVVAARAGVSVGTLYKHFRSKEALLAALAMRHREALLRVIDQCAHVGDPVERLRAIVVQGLGLAEDGRALFAVYLELKSVVETEVEALGGLGEAETHARFQRAAAEAFALGLESGHFKSALAPDRIAAVLCAALNVEIVDWAKGDRKDSLRQRGEAVLDLVLNGVKS